MKQKNKLCENCKHSRENAENITDKIRTLKIICRYPRNKAHYSYIDCKDYKRKWYKFFC